jgi:hypothetical protein
MLKFWDYVPTSQMDLVDNLIYYLPLEWEAASDSDGDVCVWDDLKKKFAYRSQNRHAVQQTQALQWYKEDVYQISTLLNKGKLA